METLSTSSLNPRWLLCTWLRSVDSIKCRITHGQSKLVRFDPPSGFFPELSPAGCFSLAFLESLSRIACCSFCCTKKPSGSVIGWAAWRARLTLFCRVLRINCGRWTPQGWDYHHRYQCHHQPSTNAATSTTTATTLILLQHWRVSCSATGRAKDLYHPLASVIQVTVAREVKHHGNGLHPNCCWESAVQPPPTIHPVVVREPPLWL